jgi:hypothetical protein
MSKPVSSHFFCAKIQHPRPFLWDFDRNIWDSVAGARSFSVGVYQWLPKASGKGLKKSRTIRVQGYVEDPQAAYARAQELCDQLNAARVMVTAPPDWLQKQYSVPRPSHVEPKLNGEGLTTGQVRALRMQVMKRVLFPHGFVTARDSSFARQDGDQIHLISFEASRGDHAYTVDLGFHYAFLPVGYCARRLELAQFRRLDCSIGASLHAFTGDERMKSFRYGSDRDALRHTLTQNANDALGVFDQYRHAWHDCEWWLQEIRQGKPISSERIAPWHTWNLPLFIAGIAMYLDESQLAMAEWERMAEGKPDDIREHYRQWILAAARSPGLPPPAG